MTLTLLPIFDEEVIDRDVSSRYEEDFLSMRENSKSNFDFVINVNANYKYNPSMVMIYCNGS